MWLPRSGIRPNESNKDKLAIQCVLAVKLTASILEFADLGWEDRTTLAVGPVEAPLVGFGIVQTQGETFDVASCRTIGFKFFQLSAAIPNLPGNRRTIKFHPGSGSRQRMQPSL